MLEKEAHGVSYNGSMLALGACGLGSIPSTPTKNERGCSTMVVPLVSNQITWVRFPSPAHCVLSK